jgi:hypothetical protein
LVSIGEQARHERVVRASEPSSRPVVASSLHLRRLNFCRRRRRHRLFIRRASFLPIDVVARLDSSVRLVLTSVRDARNSRFTKTMSAVSQAPHTGTTIVACEYDGGVVLGADTRVSTGASL